MEATPGSIFKRRRPFLTNILLTNFSRMNISEVCVGYAVLNEGTPGIICSLERGCLVLLAEPDFTYQILTDQQATELLEVIGDTELEYRYVSPARLEKDFERGVFEEALTHARELAGLSASHSPTAGFGFDY